MGSDTVRSMQFGPDGQEVNTSFNEASIQKSDAPAKPMFTQGNRQVRVQVGADGRMEVSQSQPSSAVVRTGEHADPLDNASEPRARLTENSIIKGDSIGGSMRLREAIDLGWVRKTADGFTFLGADGKFQPAQGQDAAPATKPDMKPEAAPAQEPNPADFKNIPPTSEASDAFQKSMPEAVTEQIIATMAKGSVPDFSDIARMAGSKDVAFAERAQQLHGELLASGQVVLRNVGAEPYAFEAWAKSKPEESGNAIRAMLARNPAPLAAMAREFVAQRQAHVVRRIEAAGVDTFEDHGNVFLNIAQLEKATGISIPRKQGRGDFADSNAGSISLSEAIRLGYVTVVEQS